MKAVDLPSPYPCKYWWGLLIRNLTWREGTSNIGTNSGSYTEPSDPIETLNFKPKP